MAVNTIVSGGCIVSGSHVANSVLFSSVRIHSFCNLEDAVVLPGVTIQRNCRLKKVVIDRGCDIPEGTVVGEDPVADAERFERTDEGVVLITREMLGCLGQERE
jgi:glucose-1-phosphate adenylyltransferase